MALNFMLRRTSTSVLPLAIRAFGSQRTVRSAVSVILNVEKSCLNRSRFIPYSQFSTKPSSDENLIRVIESEIGCAEQPTGVEAPWSRDFDDNHLLSSAAILKGTAVPRPLDFCIESFFSATALSSSQLRHSCLSPVLILRSNAFRSTYNQL